MPEPLVHSGLLFLSVSELAGFVRSCATHHPLSEMRKEHFSLLPHPTVPNKAHDVIRLSLMSMSLFRQMIIVIIIIDDYLWYEYSIL